MTRVKKITSTIKSHNEADNALREHGILEAKKATIDAWLKKREHDLLEEAKEKFIFNHESGETIPDRMTALAANLIAYIQERSDLFDDKVRSIELPHGRIGYRLGTPAVTTLGRMSIKAILATDVLFKRIKKFGWIKDNPRLDREKMISEYATDKEKTLKQANQVSMTITQSDEPFFVTRKITFDSSNATK